MIVKDGIPQQIKDWMKNGKHLPKFMRDFHDQKDLFKCIGGCDDESPNRSISWVQGHIYAIDFFLWFMAAHGYTLQKTGAKGLPFRDIHDTLEVYREYNRQEFAKFMAEHRKENQQ